MIIIIKIIEITVLVIAAASARFATTQHCENRITNVARQRIDKSPRSMTRAFLVTAQQELAHKSGIQYAVYACEAHSCKESHIHGGASCAARTRTSAEWPADEISWLPTCTWQAMRGARRLHVHDSQKPWSAVVYPGMTQACTTEHCVSSGFQNVPKWLQNDRNPPSKNVLNTGATKMLIRKKCPRFLVWTNQDAALPRVRGAVACTQEQCVHDVCQRFEKRKAQSHDVESYASSFFFPLKTINGIRDFARLTLAMKRLYDASFVNQVE